MFLTRFTSEVKTVIRQWKISQTATNTDGKMKPSDDGAAEMFETKSWIAEQLINNSVPDHIMHTHTLHGLGPASSTTDSEWLVMSSLGRVTSEEETLHQTAVLMGWSLLDCLECWMLGNEVFSSCESVLNTDILSSIRKFWKEWDCGKCSPVESSSENIMSRLPPVVKNRKSMWKLNCHWQKVSLLRSRRYTGR